jgi:hypothetical protein
LNLASYSCNAKRGSEWQSFCDSWLF